MTTPAQTLDRPRRSAEQVAIERLRDLIGRVLSARNIDSEGRYQGLRISGPGSINALMPDLQAAYRDTAHFTGEGE